MFTVADGSLPDESTSTALVILAIVLLTLFAAAVIILIVCLAGIVYSRQKVKKKTPGMTAISVST